MDSLDILFTALLVAGSLGFFSLLFVVPARYANFPRGVTLVRRALYCVAGSGVLFSAYLIVRDPHSHHMISTALLFATLATLIAIALERYWLSRPKHLTNGPG